MKTPNDQNNSSNKTNHAPGAGSDKQHPETPGDANERFQKQQKKDDIKPRPDAEKE